MWGRRIYIFIRKKKSKEKKKPTTPSIWMFNLAVSMFRWLTPVTHMSLDVRKRAWKMHVHYTFFKMMSQLHGEKTIIPPQRWWILDSDLQEGFDEFSITRHEMRFIFLWKCSLWNVNLSYTGTCLVYTVLDQILKKKYKKKTKLKTSVTVNKC